MIAKKRLRQLNPDSLTVKEFASYRARLEETQARARRRRACPASGRGFCQGAGGSPQAAGTSSPLCERGGLGLGQTARPMCWGMREP